MQSRCTWRPKKWGFPWNYAHVDDAKGNNYYWEKLYKTQSTPLQFFRKLRKTFRQRENKCFLLPGTLWVQKSFDLHYIKIRIFYCRWCKKFKPKILYHWEYLPILYEQYSRNSVSFCILQHIFYHHYQTIDTLLLHIHNLL